MALDEKRQSELQQAVLRELERDSVVLPTLPTVVVKALKTLERADYDMGDLARSLETDPVVAARILRLANSAAFGALQPAVSIAQAASRLGASRLKSLLIEIGAQRVFSSQDPAINQACQQLWQHSLAVGFLAREFGTAVTGNELVAESGFLGGLLHDIGKPVVAGLLLDAERRLRGKAQRAWIVVNEWIEWIASVHRPVGIALAIRWEMPELVVNAIRNSNELDTSAPHAATNFIVLGNALAKREGLYLGSYDQEAISTLILEAQALVECSAALIDEASQNLRERVTERLS